MKHRPNIETSIARAKKILNRQNWFLKLFGAAYVSAVFNDLEACWVEQQKWIKQRLEQKK